MARSFTASSSQYLKVVGVPVTAEPFTMACWFNMNDVTNTYALMALGDVVSNHRFVLFAGGATVGDPVQLNIGGAPGTNVVTTAGYTAGTWNHGAAVFASSTDRTVYLNGGNSANDTTATTVNAPTDTAIGARYVSGYGVFADGKIAEAAVWNVALTAAEVALLANGYSPWFVRPGKLVSYWPLIGRTSPEIDPVGNIGLTLFGSGAPPASAHPRIIMPRGRRFHRKATAPSFIPAWAQNSNLPVIGTGTY